MVTKRKWKEWVYGGPNKDGRFKDTSFVYILRAPNNLCKIGFCREPVWRIRKHRDSSDAPLELISLIRHPRAAELEIKLHHHFRALGRKSPSIDKCFKLGVMVRDMHYDQQHVQLEWFWLTDEDIAWLRSKTTDEVDAC